jgi:hypothetical protein
MFHSQASIGLALLPVAWASNDQAATSRPRADFDRYFPAGWSRDTVPDLPAATTSALARMKSRWQSTALAASLRRWSRAASAFTPKSRTPKSRTPKSHAPK